MEEFSSQRYKAAVDNNDEKVTVKIYINKIWVKFNVSSGKL